MAGLTLWTTACDAQAQPAAAQASDDDAILIAAGFMKVGEQRQPSDATDSAS